MNDNLASGSVIEGDAVTVTYPRWVLSGTTLYSCGSGTVAYNTSFTPNANNYIKNITYNSGTVNNVVFYTEAEDVAGVSKGTNSDRASKNQMGYTGGADTYKQATTLSPGKYIIYMRGQNGNAAARAFNFKVGDNVVFTGSIANGTNVDANSDEFSVYETSALSFASDGSSASGVDYFYVVKTGDVTVPVSVTAVGYATLCPAYDLDFTGATAIEACKAAIAGDGTITYTRVNTVKAGEGVLLHSISGGAAEEEIPVIADATLNDDNAFVGVAAEQKLAQTVGGYTNYILLNGAGGLGFYRVNANGSYVRAGSAYLKVAADAARASYLFDDEITAVNSLTPAISEGNGAVYNLSGQRVEKPTKGVYIKNGKKVIVK